MVLIGQARGGELTWKSIQKHLLIPLKAHLALFFTDAQKPTILDQMAQFNWRVPEYADWGEVFMEASRHCNSPAHLEDWRQLCSIHDQWLGGIANCGHPGSAGILLAFRWLLQQKIEALGLAHIYDYFILSRADQLYLCDHPQIGTGDRSLAPGVGWVPDGLGWGGFTDKHLYAATGVFQVLINVTTELVCDTGRWRKVLGSHDGDLNLERMLAAMWKEQGVSVATFPRVMITVKEPEDPTRWSKGEFSAVLNPFNLQLKYLGEYPDAKKSCLVSDDNVTSALEALRTYNWNSSEAPK